LLPISLSTEFQAVLDELEYAQHNFFVTGRAGTGKSTLLQLFRRTTRKKTAVLAPTGIAALQVKGQTIHSFFGFPPRMLNRNEIEKRKNNRLYKSFDMIIIDEISMVRADMIDNIDYFLQVNRENNLPFGGVQMVFFGDLFQLPPVVSTAFEKQYFQTTYPSPYFFSADVFKKCAMRVIELSKIYRQEEKQFIDLLENIRMASMEYEDLALLNSRHIPIPEDRSFYITLCSRNDIAQRINEHELADIALPAFSYTAKVEGEFSPQSYPTDLNLALKEGAQVMFVRNDVEERQFVNGTIGKITHLDHETIIVETEEQGKKQKIEVAKSEWEIMRYKSGATGSLETEVVGSFSQFPLKLAWAITIHKSQGLTLERVHIDLGAGSFETGQTYVALSRCRSMATLSLAKPLKAEDIRVDPKAKAFY